MDELTPEQAEALRIELEQYLQKLEARNRRRVILIWFALPFLLLWELIAWPVRYIRNRKNRLRLEQLKWQQAALERRIARSKKAVLNALIETEKVYRDSLR